MSFAQTVRHRLSVFWIRADRFTNFAADYTHVMNEFDPKNTGTNPSTDDLSIVLDKTRHRLEENPNEWLLILDNADDLDTFLGRSTTPDEEGLSIGRFLPRHGRMLITTRDRRFQGIVAAANDGMKVDSMSEEESKQLLMGSIPGYLIREGSDTMDQAKQLIEELGYLPLAIAQAAANILEQQLTLAEYVSFYQDKKQRMGLMQSPAHDFQTTDPRNASQSVNITWQISFDVLKEKHPLSAIFLTYIGCFHWRNIPRVLLQRLPQFRDLPESVFIQLTKKPLNLSLVEEQEIEPGFIEYMVHPLLHENILSRLRTDEIVCFLNPLTETIGLVFPTVAERTDSGWPVAVYLSSHVARMIELCEEAHLSSGSLSVLLLDMSRFLGVSNMFATAVSYAEKAKYMGDEVWSSSPELKIAFWRNLNWQYGNASRKTDQEREAREALQWLDSDFVKNNMEASKLEMNKVSLLSDICTSLIETGTDAEREEIHRKQLSTGLVDEWSSQGVIIRHNLSHALYHQQKYEEAQVLNSALLKFAETEEGKREVSPRVYLIMLNLKCSIIVSLATKGATYEGFVLQETLDIYAHDERRGIHELVFKESMTQLGIEDEDTWKATNNLIGYLYSLSLTLESGPILEQVLAAGIESKVQAEGKFMIPLRSFRNNAEGYLESIETFEGKDSKKAKEFRTSLENWIICSGCSPDRVPPSNKNKLWIENILNNQGVDLQRKGRFEEAEQFHTRSIDLCVKNNKPVPDVFRNNLMLSIARQGRIDDAKAYREEYRAELEGPETAFGTMEVRMQRDQMDREVYEKAQMLLDTGQLDEEWMQENSVVLKRTQDRYGKLERKRPPVIEEVKGKNARKGIRSFRLGVSHKL